MALSGKLKVTVDSAEILSKQDLTGKGDPYVKLTYNGVVLKTTVIKDTQNPKWNEVFEFDVSARDTDRSVSVEVWDEDLVNKDDLIGSGKLANIDQYLNNYKQISIPLVNQKKGNSQEGNVILLVKLVSSEAETKEKEREIGTPDVETDAPGESGTLRRKKKKKKHHHDDEGDNGLNSTRGSSSSIHGGGRSRGNLHRGEGTQGTLRSRVSRSGSADSIRTGSVERDRGGTLRYWQTSSSAGAASRNNLNSTVGSTASTASQRSHATKRDPSNPIHNFVGNEDDSFGYMAEKYQTSPGPAYDLSSPVPVVDKNNFHAVIGTEDRLKHFVTKTPGKGPADLLPNRDSTTFNPRPFYATFGKYNRPSWVIRKTFTKDGPVENATDPYVKSTTPTAPKYHLSKDSREKYFEKSSISKGPGAYNHDRDWKKPSSELGSFSKGERNSSNWIFGK